MTLQLITIPRLKNRQSVSPESFILAVRGLRVVERFPIVTHRLEAACFPTQAFTLQITNAKGRETIIIVQIFRSGEVVRMNIEDSCRLFLCFAKHDVGRSFYYCCSEGGEKRQRAAWVLLGGRRRDPFESEGSHLLVGHLSVISAPNFISLSPYPIFIMRFSTMLRFYLQLRFYVFIYT